MKLAVTPPVLPMLAKRVDAIPPEGNWLYEPKWDGFRVLVFRDGNEVLLQSRDERSLNRYFPEMLDPLREQLPPKCVLDGELVIANNSISTPFSSESIPRHRASSYSPGRRQLPASSLISCARAYAISVYRLWTNAASN